MVGKPTIHSDFWGWFIRFTPSGMLAAPICFWRSLVQQENFRTGSPHVWRFEEPLKVPETIPVLRGGFPRFIICRSLFGISLRWALQPRFTICKGLYVPHFDICRSLHRSRSVFLLAFAGGKMRQAVWLRMKELKNQLTAILEPTMEQRLKPDIILMHSALEARRSLGMWTDSNWGFLKKRQPLVIKSFEHFTMENIGKWPIYRWCTY